MVVAARHAVVTWQPRVGVWCDVLVVVAVRRRSVQVASNKIIEYSKKKRKGSKTLPRARNVSASRALVHSSTMVLMLVLDVSKREGELLMVKRRRWNEQREHVTKINHKMIM